MSSSKPKLNPKGLLKQLAYELAPPEYAIFLPLVYKYIDNMLDSAAERIVKRIKELINQT